MAASASVYIEVRWFSVNGSSLSPLPGMSMRIDAMPRSAKVCASVAKPPCSLRSPSKLCRNTTSGHPPAGCSFSEIGIGDV